MAEPRKSEVIFIPGTVLDTQTDLVPNYGSTTGGTSRTTAMRFVYTDKVYFKTADGKAQLRPLPGWNQSTAGLVGKLRTIFRYEAGTLIGTSKRLYFGSTNITPLSTSTTAIADSLDTVMGSAVITVNATGHGQIAGDRVKIASAADVGGIAAATYINKEHIITSVPSADEFTITVGTTAGSTVDGGGGGSTTYQKQITMPSDSDQDPVIWSIDLFGNDVVMTPGQQSGVYLWQGSTATAPALLSGAPAAVNWVYVMNNAVHTLGSGGVANRIKTSDVGDGTTWTISAATLAWQYDATGYGEFLSQVKAGGITESLLFSNARVASLRYVGLPNIYEFNDVSESDGLIGPKAATQINGIPYWMGKYDFYTYDGTRAVPLEGFQNRKTVLTNALGGSYIRKIFAAPNPVYKQIFWFFGGISDDDEPNTYVIYDYEEKHATTGYLTRTAAENPFYGDDDSNSAIWGRGVDASGTTAELYSHNAESSIYLDEDTTSGATAIARTAFARIGAGDLTMEITEIEPDVMFIGNDNAQSMDIKIITKNYSSVADTEVEYGPYTVNDDTTFIDTDDVEGARYRAYEFSQDNHQSAESHVIVCGLIETLQEGVPVEA